MAPPIAVPNGARIPAIALPDPGPEVHAARELVAEAREAVAKSRELIARGRELRKQSELIFRQFHKSHQQVRLKLRKTA